MLDEQVKTSLATTPLSGLSVLSLPHLSPCFPNKETSVSLTELGLKNLQTVAWRPGKNRWNTLFVGTGTCWQQFAVTFHKMSKSLDLCGYVPVECNWYGYFFYHNYYGYFFIIIGMDTWGLYCFSTQQGAMPTLRTLWTWFSVRGAREILDQRPIGPAFYRKQRGERNHQQLWWSQLGPDESPAGSYCNYVFGNRVFFHILDSITKILVTSHLRVVIICLVCVLQCIYCTVC
jgi:hypothetical protein